MVNRFHPLRSFIDQAWNSRSHLLFLLSLFAIICYLYTISKGFFFLGDTNNYLEYSGHNSLVGTFFWHDRLWTPGMALVLTALRWFVTPVVSLQLYLVVCIVVSWFTLAALFSYLGMSRSMSLTSASMVMLAGVQHWLWKSALSEPLLMSTLLTTILLQWRFFESKKVGWLILSTFFAIMLSLSRYQGALLAVILWSGIIIQQLFSPKDSKQNGKSRGLLLTALVQSAILSLIPVSWYVLIYKTQTGYWLPVRDPSTVGTNLASLMTSLLSISPYDASLTVLGWLTLGLIGFNTSWKKSMMSLLWLVALAVMGFSAFSLYSAMRYNAVPYIPGRYLSPVFPVIGIMIFLIGSLVASKTRLAASAAHYITPVTILLAAVTLSISSLHTLSLARTVNNPLTDRFVGFSPVIQAQCPDTVIRHTLSRNWVVNSFEWLCPNIQVLNEQYNEKILSDQVALSAYKLELPGEESQTLWGKPLHWYQVGADAAVVPLGEIFSHRALFE